MATAVVGDLHGGADDPDLDLAAPVGVADPVADPGEADAPRTVHLAGHRTAGGCWSRLAGLGLPPQARFFVGGVETSMAGNQHAPDG
jgi:hypothetical protein